MATFMVSLKHIIQEKEGELGIGWGGAENLGMGRQ